MLPKHTEFYLKERNMNLAKFYYVRFFIKSNQSLLLSHHHSTSALVSEILESVLQTVQKNKTIYI